MSKKFNFDAVGRKLFANERIVAEVFNAKYAPDTASASEAATQARMQKTVDRVRKAVASGNSPQTEFFGQVEKATKEQGGSAGKSSPAKAASSQRSKALSLQSSHPVGGRKAV